MDGLVKIGSPLIVFVPTTVAIATLPFFAVTVILGKILAATCAALTLTAKLHTSAVFAASAAPGRLLLVLPTLQVVTLVGYEWSLPVVATAMLSD